MADSEPPSNLRLLYCNVGHGRDAQLHMLQFALSNLIDIIVVTEPYVPPNGPISSPEFLHTSNGRCAIFYSPLLKIDVLRSSNLPNVCAIAVGENLTLVGGYFSPNEPLLLSPLTSFLNSIRSPLIVAGDFNCTTSFLPSQTTNTRGEIFENFLFDSGLALQNSSQPTRIHNNIASINDYICTRSCSIDDFYIHDSDTLSDHLYITFSIPRSPECTIPSKIGINSRVLEFRIKNMSIPNDVVLESRDDIDQALASLNAKLCDAIESSSYPFEPRKTSLPYWSPTLETMKRTLNSLHRRICSSNTYSPLTLLILKESYRCLRKYYRIAIHEAKLAAWKALCTRFNAWGEPYNKLVRFTNRSIPFLQKPDGTLCNSRAENAHLLLDTKFPKVDNHVPPPPSSGSEGPPNKITARAIAEVLKGTANKKSPGIDKISNKAVKLFHKHFPAYLSRLYTACLSLSYFPRCWKQGLVIFIPKPGKDPYTPEGYRPITLLPVFGKVFEHLLRLQLNSHFEDSKFFHRQQFGFRKGLGAEQAVHSLLDSIADSRQNFVFTCVLSLDIKGAFDHALWPNIVSCLNSNHVPSFLSRTIESYFTDRTAQVDSVEVQLERGCPQGSVLGPTLWNVLYNDVIIELHRRFNVVVFADDTGLVFGGDSKRDIETKGNSILQFVVPLLRDRGLELNFTKLEFLLFSDCPKMLSLIHI